MSPYSVWIYLSAWLVSMGWILSACHLLNKGGYLGFLVLFVGVILVWWRRESQRKNQYNKLTKKIKWWRFKRPLPMIYSLILVTDFLGGALHPPNNYDALCYRIPRILHWWSENQWHWIGGVNDRMDFSATGMEWIMAPILIVTNSDRFLFLINVISYALLPGFIYMAFTALGISRRVAWSWMWILPTAYCFALQAGSIGNDCFAAIYFLSSIAYAIRAKKEKSFWDATLALFSLGLLLGSKATNIPLILPIAVIILPIFIILKKRPVSTIIVIIVTLIISYLPIAVANIHNTGVWSGDPLDHHKVKLKNPVAGIIGNTLQIGIGAVAPAILPTANLWNDKVKQLMDEKPLRILQAHYPRLDLDIGELAMEESAGVGLGISVLILISVAVLILSGSPKIESRLGFLFGLLCWVSLIAFMARLGSESTARLISAYYPGLIIPVLAFQSQSVLVRKKWWNVVAVSCQLAVFPALVLNPSRPLVSPSIVLFFADQVGISSSTIKKISDVYSIYSKRNDNLSQIREKIPKDCKLIGFAGGGNEPEYSLWKPLGVSRVVDSKMDSKKASPCCYVVSETGFKDRFHSSLADFCKKNADLVIARIPIRILASQPETVWVIIKSFRNEFNN